MKYNPEIHHRRSIRMKEYDYASAGEYFVSICVEGRECLLGEMVDNEMRPKASGRMVEAVWQELSNKFKTIVLDEFVVMPNHFHGIVCIAEPLSSAGPFVGAPLCGRPSCPTALTVSDLKTGHPHRGAPTVGNIIEWFKTMTTNAYIRGVKQSNWLPFPGRLWQRNYYEQIIRSEKELHAARRYILENPIKWVMDKENPANRL